MQKLANQLITPEIEAAIRREFPLFKEFIIKHFGAEVFEEKIGGYQTMKRDRVIESIPLDFIPKDKDDKYFSLSQEKANRAWEMNEVRGDVTSAQSACKQALPIKNLRTNEFELWGKYPGAIIILRPLKTAFSFSGLPALLDEAWQVWLTFRIEYLDYKGIQKFAEIRTENIYIQKMLTHFAGETITD